MHKITMFGTTDYTLSDAELISQIQWWNTWAFEIIYERYSKSLYNYILTLLNFNADESGLVLSDVFIKAYEYLQKNDIDHLKSFLFRIAHNASVDWIRVHHNQEVSMTHEVEHHSDPKDILHKNNLDTHYKKTLVKRYLSMLDEKYRSVLYLMYYEDKSYEEIAVIQNSNKNSIGTLAFQWKKKLEESMRNAGIDPNIFLI